MLSRITASTAYLSAAACAVLICEKEPPWFNFLVTQAEVVLTTRKICGCRLGDCRGGCCCACICQPTAWHTQRTCRQDHALSTWAWYLRLCCGM